MDDILNRPIVLVLNRILFERKAQSLIERICVKSRTDNTVREDVFLSWVKGHSAPDANIPPSP
jgi:hypothetical protein